MTKRNSFLAIALTLTLVLGESWVGLGRGWPQAILSGSEQDPLVSRSYVDSRIEALLSSFNGAPDDRSGA